MSLIEEVAKKYRQAEEIASKLEKVKEGSYFSFDKNYSNSNSVDREFLQSLVNKEDFGSFKDTYING